MRLRTNWGGVVALAMVCLLACAPAAQAAGPSGGRSGSLFVHVFHGLRSVLAAVLGVGGVSLSPDSGSNLAPDSGSNLAPDSGSNLAPDSGSNLRVALGVTR